MGFLDLFSSSFFFSVVIVILVCVLGGIFAYVNHKISEQNHKLTSMIDLVSMLAQDLDYLKTRSYSSKNNMVEDIDTTVNTNVPYSWQLMGGERENIDTGLISVSDEGTNEDEMNDDDSVDEEYDDEDEDDIDEDDEEFDDSQNNIKTLNLTLANEDIINDSPIEDLNCELSESVDKEEIKTIHIEPNSEIEHFNYEMPTLNVSGSDDDMKHVAVIDLGSEIDDLHASKSEYRKMSLSELREVAVSKGLVVDASKLKKNELIKMLSDK